MAVDLREQHENQKLPSLSIYRPQSEESKDLDLSGLEQLHPGRGDRVGPRSSSIPFFLVTWGDTPAGRRI
jgi:hypothetical protein